MAVVDEMKAAGVWVFGGGLEEEVDRGLQRRRHQRQLVITDGPFAETKEFLGGFCVINVPDDETAKMWAGKVAEACGWPQEVRRFKGMPRAVTPTIPDRPAPGPSGRRAGAAAGLLLASIWRYGAWDVALAVTAVFAGLVVVLLASPGWRPFGTALLAGAAVAGGALLALT